MNVNECPICLEKLEAGLKTPCGHEFCTHCIVGWQEKETNSPTTPPYTCPSCRSSIPYIELESYSSGSDESTSSDTDDEPSVTFRSRHECKENHKKFLACMGCSLFTTILTFWILGMTQGV